MDSLTLNSDSAVLDMDSWTLSDSAIHAVHARLGGHGACWAGRLESHRLVIPCGAQQTSAERLEKSGRVRFAPSQCE